MNLNGSEYLREKVKNSFYFDLLESVGRKYMK